MALRTTARPAASPGLRTWLILIGAAAQRQTLRDEDVSERAGLTSRRTLTRALERISAFCRAHGLPALEALVVDAATGRVYPDEAAAGSTAAREEVFSFDWYAVQPPSEDELAAVDTTKTKATVGKKNQGARRRSRGRDRQQPAPTRRRPARGRKAIPKGERTRNVGDDDAAAAELAAAAPVTRGPAGATTREPRAATWRVAECLLTLRNQVNARSPNRNKTSDGTIGDLAHQGRNSDHNAWVRDGAIGVVTAMDITHDAARGCDAGALAEAIRASRDVRVKYIIWNRRIANSASINGVAPWTWRTYGGANPHDKHVHISVKPEKASYDLTNAWAI